MSDSKLKELVKKRASMKCKVTNFKTFLSVFKDSEKLSSLQASEVKCRLEKIESLYCKYDALQTEIELLSETPEECYAEREQFENQYYNIVSEARMLLGNHNQQVHEKKVGDVSSFCDAETGGTHSYNLVKLPKIDLIPFNGDYQHWLEFKDTFTSLINFNEKLDDISKFHYLRSSLKAKAEMVISNLDFSSKNYKEAWSLLCERYDNKRLLVNNHVQALFSVEKIHRESSKSIRNIVDLTNKNLRALSSLGQPISQWDTLIIFMMSTKLDFCTSRQWEEYRNTLTDPPLLKDFIKFLNGRADLLETLEDNKQNYRTRFDIQKPNKSFIVSTSAQVQGHHKISCPMCNDTHFLYSCPIFRDLNVQLRTRKANEFNVCLNCLKPGHNIKKCKLSHCKYCTLKHNTLLHEDKQSSTSLQKENVALSTSLQSSIINHTVILSTAMVRVYDKSGSMHEARLLLDNGSTANFMTQSLCEKLGLERYNAHSTVTGINNQSSSSTHSCDLIIESRCGGFKSTISCYIISEITKLIPSTYINIRDIPLPSGIQLADPNFNIPSSIDLLVGAEIFWAVLGSSSINLGNRQPSLQESKLGWLLTGCVYQLKHNNFCHLVQNELHELNKFWELDTISSIHCMSQEERACEQSFAVNTKRDGEGRFVVTLPLKDSPEVLGDSYQLAKLRFLSLERRFERDPVFKKNYIDFMQEYIHLGHMTINSCKKHDSIGVNYYLPHHGVIKETSTTTKLRAVFDASAVSTSGKSLNHILMVGPTLQSDLYSILLRFRQHKFVVTSDIEKMYRAVFITPMQRSLQQILFRFDSSEPLKTYTLNTLTYGTASAPYLATKCIMSLAESCANDKLKTAMTDDFYVDDFLSGGDSIDSVRELCHGVTTELNSAKFHLRKWQSNNKEILQSISDIKGNSEKSMNLNDHISCKTLGMNWNCNDDTFFFSIDKSIQKKVTKRHILSVISQIFDPLGLLGPCIVEAKIIMQKLWVEKCEWDDEVSHDIKQMWTAFTRSLPYLNYFSIKRWVMTDSILKIELHMFTDSSSFAYGACAFIRCVTLHGTIKVHLLTSKNKVAPLKPTTIPRLELCAALLGARLYVKILSSFRLHFEQCFFWCDSTIVLGWLSSTPNQLKQFVRNRVFEIQETTNNHTWCYVPTDENPADLVSRGVKAEQLGKSLLWWSGPKFLYKSQDYWPKMTNETKNISLPEICTLLDTKLNKNLNSNPTNNQTQENNKSSIISTLTHKVSNLNKLIRIIAYTKRFIHNYLNNSKKADIHTGYLSLSELHDAQNSIIRVAQMEMFPSEYSMLLLEKSLPTKNRLNSLSPFLDSHKVIRVGGRLKNSYYSFDIKHPILLCSKHSLTLLIFRNEHTKLLHPGPQLLLSKIRQTYWTLNGRNLAKQTIRSCIKCCRFKTQSIQPIMSDLPHSRVHLDYPFLNTGIDYAGPVLIADRKGRGCKVIKSYICIFVCLAVKALHLELVTDLTKECFIAALNRFIARRSKPQTIYSDNGKTFVGACNELSRFLSNLSGDIYSKFAQDGIKFKFIPPYSPHYGGIWEAAVKSVKHHLRRVLGLAHLTYEEMSTCLTQIEAILNSRPLTPLSSDPSDLTPLTPAHFLVGRPLTSFPHPQIIDANINRLQRFERIEKIRQHFWQRYYNEYISTLQQKTKWHQSKGELKVGALVLVREKDLPPLLWLLGRVSRVYEDRTGVARVADIVTKKGTIQRAYNNLCPLPLS